VARRYFAFELDAPTTVDIGWEAATDTSFWGYLGAPMLERIDSTGDIGAPRPYVDNGDTATVSRAVCEDTDGSTFNRTRWTRRCVNLCPDGFSSNCIDRTSTHCYQETSFHISQRAIESGEMFKQSGFASGNFNYRIESVGLNFVGSGVRDCSDSDSPTTCHAAGYVPYSLSHEGPYFVRNHTGDDFRAQLFTANIEHARGLGTERYLTNPLGSADSELLDQYLRREFNGRPLDGNFVLRVWEEPGLNFNAVQDVQIVFNYRYWTRFD